MSQETVSFPSFEDWTQLNIKFDMLYLAIPPNPTDLSRMLMHRNPSGIIIHSSKNYTLPESGTDVEFF